MTNSRFLNRLGKLCAVLAVTFILPMLGYAGEGKGMGDGQYNGKQNGHDKYDIPVVKGHGMDDIPVVKGHDNGNIPVTPEPNVAWVLVPFFGAVLLFSARQLFRPMANQK